MIVGLTRLGHGHRLLPRRQIAFGVRCLAVARGRINRTVWRLGVRKLRHARGRCRRRCGSGIRRQGHTRLGPVIARRAGSGRKGNSENQNWEIRFHLNFLIWVGGHVPLLCRTGASRGEVVLSASNARRGADSSGIQQISAGCVGSVPASRNCRMVQGLHAEPRANHRSTSGTGAAPEANVRGHRQNRSTERECPETRQLRDANAWLVHTAVGLAKTGRTNAGLIRTRVGAQRRFLLTGEGDPSASFRVGPRGVGTPGGDAIADHRQRGSAGPPQSPLGWQGKAR